MENPYSKAWPWSKQEWTPGDLITAERLNAIEDKIDEIAPKAMGAVRYDTDQTLSEEAKEQLTNNLNLMGIINANINNVQNIKDGIGTGSLIEGNIEQNIALGEFSHTEGNHTRYQYALTSSENDNKIYQVNVESIQAFVGNYIIGARAILGTDYSEEINNAPIVTNIKIDRTNISRPVYLITFNKTLGVLDNTLVTFLLGAFGTASHVEGDKNLAHGIYAHVEGGSNTAYGRASHVEGEHNRTIGMDSHAEGYYTYAIGDSSHAEGQSTTADGDESHAEGSGNIASGRASHVEGSDSKAVGDYSHAEGYYTLANGAQSHAEGYFAIANGINSHAEGNFTQASGINSHAEGNETRASGMNQHVIGKCNIEDLNDKYIEIVGNGTNLWEGSSNARTLDWDGNEWLAGNLILNNKTLTANKISNIPVFIVGTQTENTASWTGSTNELSSLQEGQVILYWLPQSSEANATLTLTLENNVQTEAIDIYINGSTRCGTQIAKNNAILMVYYNNQWHINKSLDTTTDTYNITKYQFPATNAENNAISTGLGVFNMTGNIIKLEKNKPFDITKPILYIKTAFPKASTTSTNNYIIYGTPITFNITTATGGDSAAGNIAYIKGTLSNKKFTPVDFTVTEPTSNDDYIYMLLGHMTAKNKMILPSEHPMFKYKNGFKSYFELLNELL